MGLWMGNVGVAASVFVGVWMQLSDARAADAPSKLTASSSPDEIYGGHPVELCDWPSTVFLGGCTGTLVHPEVVIYAAHCGGVSSVWFGENSNIGGGKTVYPEFCKVYPGGGPGYGNDFAVCKLSQPVTDVPIVPILMGCETDILTPGREVVAVGFGNTDTGDFGVKYEVTTTMNYIENDEAQIGGGGLAPCHGDSGGPAYVKLPASEGYDDTWRVFGITSWGGECGGGGFYSMMHEGIAWFESETGVDLTPCHDVDGTWNPGPDCESFPLAPGEGNGSWQAACEMGPVGGWSETCGDPYMENEPEEDDLEPPTVAIVSPPDGSELQLDGDGKATIEVLVQADDGDGWGIRDVVLEIDGAAVGAPDADAPFAFDITLPQGSYQLVAVATDRADNQATSDVVGIGVGQPPPGPDPEPPDDPPDSGGSSTGADDGDPPGGGGETGGDPFGPGGPALPAGFGQDYAATGCACQAAGARADASWLMLLLLGLLTKGARRAGPAGRRPRRFPR